MTALFSYLITFLGILYWLFRVIVCLMATLKAEFFAAPVDLNLEIGLLFGTILCFVFSFNFVCYLSSIAIFFLKDLFNYNLQLKILSI